MNKKFLALLGIYTIVAIAFYYLQTSDLILAIARGCGVSGLTFLSISLLITPLAMFFKQFAKYIILRIESGVFGFLLVAVHIALLLTYTFKFNFSLILSMPVLLAAAIAFVIYLAMVATGGADNIKKLGFGKWKTIHRFGYIAFLLAVYHFTSKYPKSNTEPFGLLLLLLVLFTILFQIGGAIKTIMKKGQNK